MMVKIQICSVFKRKCETVKIVRALLLESPKNKKRMYFGDIYILF